MYRIMAVIEQCMCGEVGGRLGDIEVCEMLETVLTTCCQMRLSGMQSTVLYRICLLIASKEILRRYAESTMHAIVRRIFGRLQFLNPIDEEAKLVNTDIDSDENELRMNVQATEEAGPTEQGNLAEAPPVVEAVVGSGTKTAPEEPQSEPPEEQATAPATVTPVRSDCTWDSLVSLQYH